MQGTRLLVASLGTALLGLVPIGLAGPAAHAGAVPVPTSVSGEISRSVMYYKDSFTISGSVDDPSGNPVPDTADGTVVLERRNAGTSRWRQVAEAPDEGDFFFPDLVGLRNATYRIVYSGGTEGATSYEPSGAKTSIKVARIINTRGTNPRPNVFFLKGTLKPSYKGKPVVIQRKTCNSCSWKVWKTVKTNRKSKFSARIYAKRTVGKVWYRPLVKSSTRYIKTIGQGVVIETIRARSADGQSSVLR